MLAVVSCAAALAARAHSQEPEPAPAQSQASTKPPAASSGTRDRKQDLSGPEQTIRRMRARDGAGTGPASRSPEKGSKALPFEVIRSDRNSFHPPTKHGKADPPIPVNPRTRHE